MFLMFMHNFSRNTTREKLPERTANHKDYDLVTDTGYKMQFTQDIIFNSMNRDSKIGILEAWMPTTERHNSRRASK